MKRLSAGASAIRWTTLALGGLGIVAFAAWLWLPPVGANKEGDDRTLKEVLDQTTLGEEFRVGSQRLAEDCTPGKKTVCYTTSLSPREAVTLFAERLRTSGVQVHDPGCEPHRSFESCSAGLSYGTHTGSLTSIRATSPGRADRNTSVAVLYGDQYGQ